MPTDSHPTLGSHVTGRGVTRRATLAGLLLGSAGLAAAPLLSACAGGTSTSGEPAGSADSSGTPQRGGTARVVAFGSSLDATFNPFNLASEGSYMGAFSVWDPLATIRGSRIELVLAEAVEPNQDGTQWTIRLRPNVTWSDGSKLTSADVVWSLAQLSDPKVSPGMATMFSDLDTDRLRSIDEHSLIVPLKRARGDFIESVLAQYSLVVKQGTKDFSRPPGTGPFTLGSFRPGQGLQLVRNERYWGGEVYLDKIEVTFVADPGTRLNAVKGGQADYASGISPTGARTLESDPNVVLNRGAAGGRTAMCFAFNTTQQPFNDPRVVTAIKRAIDRQAMVDTVLAGYGIVGADVVGLGLPGYDESLRPPERNLDEARSLFSAAGVNAFTLRAADLTPGLLSSAELFAQQLADAGVRVTIDKAAADSYFADYPKVMATPAQAFYFVNRPPAVHIGAFMGASGGFNVTGYTSPTFEETLVRVRSTLDEQQRNRELMRVEQELAANDGLVVWGFKDNIDAARPTLMGVEPNQSVPTFRSAFFRP